MVRWQRKHHPDAKFLSDAVIDESGAYTLAITSAATANTLTIAPAGAGADVQDDAGGSLTLNGALTIDAGSFSLIGGTLTTSSVYVGSSGHFIGKGDVQAPINNAGTVEALGNLSLLGAVTGAGSFTIDSGNTLEFGKSVAAGATVSFADPAGTLQLDNSTGAVGSSFGATINNFGGSDVIDLTDLAYASSGETFTWNSANNALTVSNGTQSTTITLAGSYTIGNFALASNSGVDSPSGHPGTEVLWVSTGPTVDIWNGTGDWIADAATDWSTGSPPNTGDQATIASGQVQVNSDLTLDDNAIQNNAQINVGVTAAAILTLDDATTMTGGTLLINTDSSATFDDASVSATAITVGNAQSFSVLSGPSENFGSYAQGINDAGEIVGYFTDSSESQHGYILSDGSYTQIDDPALARTRTPKVSPTTELLSAITLTPTTCTTDSSRHRKTGAMRAAASFSWTIRPLE